MRKTTPLLSICIIITVAALIYALSQALLVDNKKANEPTQQTPRADHIIWHKRYKHIDPKTGFRIAYYRAALPETVPGGTRLTVQQTHTHFKNKTAIFLDVMAHTGSGPDPIDGTWRLSKKRTNIKGSTWLADVGTGTLTPEMTTYFKSNLEKITKGDKTKTIVIYCTSDCWMGWNAIRRASNWGYKNLLWFPEGSDEWGQLNYPLENATPIPLELAD